ncbi:MAG: hypothetical protein QM756_34715 [Polyangiaceae bacterium]
MWTHSRGWLVACSLVALLGCDKRTAEEKGTDYAKEKLGFVEGAAKVLEERGKGLGKAVGKGVGEVARGTGSGVMDVVNRPVKVELGSELADSGMKVLQAHEAGIDSSGRGVVVYLEFPKALELKLRLQALGENNAELARAELADTVSQAAGSQKNFTFAFPSDMRLSSVASYVLHAGVIKAVTLDAALSDSGIALSQLKEQGSEVTVYAIFSKPFNGGLQLRAQSGAGSELGRSPASGKLSYAADSANYLSFKFDARTPLDSVTQYTLHQVAPAKPTAP